MAVEYRSFSMRLDRELRKWLHEFAESIDMSDSGAARMILRNAMGDPMIAAVLKEEVIRQRALIQASFERAQKAMWATLHEELGDLERLVGQPVESDEVLALPAQSEDVVETEVVLEGLHGTDEHERVEREGLHGGRRRRRRG